jgi:hypothetical protein
MSPLDLINHLLNFAAPAVVVGVLLAVVAPLLGLKQAVARARYAQAAINSVAGLVVLVFGLWFFGRDGKMATYLAMVAAIGTCQWWGAGFKRG